MNSKCFFIKDADGYINRVVCSAVGTVHTFYITSKDRDCYTWNFYVVRYKRGQYKVFQDHSFVPISMKICFPAWDLRRIRSIQPYTLLKQSIRGGM